MPALAKRKLDVVPLWLKIWLINRYGLCKGKRNHAEFAIFKSYEKKIPTCTQIMTLYHGINKISVYTSKYIPHIYRIQWIDRDSPSPTMSSSCTNLCVCMCVCEAVGESETGLSQCFVDHWAVCERQRATVCVWE